jgi:hypothetical protein
LVLLFYKLFFGKKLYFMDEQEGFSIWFFVGIMLAIYGPIVLIANIPGFAGESPHVVLERLHAGIWWGDSIDITRRTLSVPSLAREENVSP